MADRAPGIVFSRLRGELVELPENAILINDSYNANPVSMRAALDHLASLDAGGGGSRCSARCASSGPMPPPTTARSASTPGSAGVELIIGVGEHASAYEPDQQVADAEAAADALAEALGPGDAVLVKGSRAVGLERVAEKLADGARCSARS